jgi:hypothetical protein
MTWGRNDLRRIDLGAKQLGANRLGGETTGYPQPTRVTAHSSTLLDVILTTNNDLVSKSDVTLYVLILVITFQ